MNTLICAGGTGARSLESVFHLCAAGLGPQRLRIFVVDGDTSNGNLSRASAVLASYLDCQKKYQDTGFFTTEFEFFQPSGEAPSQEGTERLDSWNPMPAKSLLDLVKNDTQQTAAMGDVLNLLFEEKEQNTPVDGGYRGRPAIGAAALALLKENGGRDTQPADGGQRLANALKADLQGQQRVKVFLAGSVFGGTGASTLYPISRFIKEDLKGDKATIGVAALVPYFQFSGDPGAGELAAKAENFDLATKMATEFYTYLFESGDWHFNSLYWIGYNQPRLMKYQHWGNEQVNPAHFVDLLAGLACLDFFAKDESKDVCKVSGLAGDEPFITWEDLPGYEDVRSGLLTLFLAGMIHKGQIAPSFAEMANRPRDVYWFKELFASRRPPETLDSKDFQAWDTFWNLHEKWWLQMQTEAERRLKLLPGEAAAGDHIDYNRPELALGRPDISSGEVFHSVLENMADIDGPLRQELARKTAPSRYLKLLRRATERMVNRYVKSNRERMAGAGAFPK